MQLICILVVSFKFDKFLFVTNWNYFNKRIESFNNMHSELSTLIRFSCIKKISAFSRQRMINFPDIMADIQFVYAERKIWLKFILKNSKLREFSTLRWFPIYHCSRKKTLVQNFIKLIFFFRWKNLPDEHKHFFLFTWGLRL